MKERILKPRTAEKLTQAAFGEKIGLTRDGVASYERGAAKPTGTAIVAMVKVFGVNQQWLETGEGEMYACDRNETIERISKRYSSSMTFRAMLDAYAQLDEAGQAAIERYVGLLLEAMAVGGDVTKVAVDVSEAELTEQADEMESAGQEVARDPEAQ